MLTATRHVERSLELLALLPPVFWVRKDEPLAGWEKSCHAILAHRLTQEPRLRVLRIGLAATDLPDVVLLEGSR